MTFAYIDDVLTNKRDDVERAAKKLKVLGSGFQVISVGSQKMVQSVPCELSSDHTTVLVLAQDQHFVTIRSLENELKWRRDRTEAVLVMKFVFFMTDFVQRTY